MSSHKGPEKPQRSCLGCRTAKARTDLIRYVLSPAGEVVPDLDARLPGRGAYTCVNSTCLATAVRQRQFNRAFRCETALQTPEEMTELVARLLRERITGCIGLANRAGKVIAGGSMVSDALRSKAQPGLVLIARDVSEAIGEKIATLAHVHGVRYENVMTKDEFGAILGKAPRSAIAIRPGGFVGRLVELIERYRNFLGEVR